MIGKLIVHRSSRDKAIRCMARCLSELDIGPIKTTVPFHREVLAHPEFIQGHTDTGFIERNF
jgi:acetyl-CoA carboxylase biotin carboxylase subunit